MRGGGDVVVAQRDEVPQEDDGGVFSAKLPVPDASVGELGLGRPYEPGEVCR